MSHEKIRNDISKAIKEQKDAKIAIETFQEIVKEKKALIIDLLKQLETKSLQTDNGKASYSEPHSFNKMLCEKNHPDEIEKFTKRETITSVVSTFDKKGFMNVYPEIYKKYLQAQTVRLTIR